MAKAKDAPVTGEPSNLTAAPTEFPVSLDEACQDLSLHVRKPTLLAAFHSDEERAGRLTDTVTAYRARLEAFRKRPV